MTMPTPMPTRAAPRLSVIVITRNEAERLPTCLASVAFADECIVVDSASSDGTAALARQHGARVISTADWPGFGPQKQRALAAATGTWVLSIDADEWLDDELAAAVRAITESAITESAISESAITESADSAHQPAGYAVSRMSAFCGQWMRAGSWYPDLGVRLFKRGSARFSDDQVHERLLLTGATATLPGRLLHNSITTLHDGLDKMNRYSTGRAADQRGQGRRGGLGRALGHGLWAFVRSYGLRRGFLDGRLGLVLALLDAQASSARYLKLWLDGRPVPHKLPPPRR